MELIESFIGYTHKSEIISFTPNPKLIMSGDYTGSVNLWDLEKQKLTYHKATHTLRSKKARLAYPIKKGIPILIVGSAQKI